jgi:hypothetical protein
MVYFSSKTNEALEFAMNVLSQKRQSNEMTELAVGCYRADK